MKKTLEMTLKSFFTKAIIERMNRLKKITLLLIALLLSFIAGCSGQKEKDENLKLTTNPASRTEFLMGTVVTVKIYDQNKENVLDPVFERIKVLADQITVNDGEDKSEVDHINSSAGTEPVKVSTDIYTLIKAGKTYSERANGSFDITVGPLSTLWHIGFPDARKPSQDEINQVLPLIDYRAIQLNSEKQTVLLKNKGMQLDLGAIAKGFITDEVVKVLKKHRVHSAIIDLGGNVFVFGKNATGNKWTVGIQDPFSPRGEVIGNIQLANKSVVTSGIYERYLTVGNKTYHHILNPKDGYPFNNDIAGVSVITDKSIDGDSLSTLLFSKGVKEGLAFAEESDSIEAIFITHDKKIYMTDGLKGQFNLTNDEFTIQD